MINKNKEIVIREVNILDIIRDPMWQFIGAILVVIGIIISIILHWIQQPKNSLSWKIVSNTPLVKISSEIRGNLQVLFEGNPVKDIQLIIVKIINSGNVSIKSGDYERPINLNFDINAQILTAEVINTIPSNIEASTNIEGNKIFITPTLLNKGDSITIKTLVNQFDNHISVDGRIVGVKDIQKIADIDPKIQLIIKLNGILTGMIMTILLGLVAAYVFELLNSLT